MRSFVLVGPIKKDFGSVAQVLEFLGDLGCEPTLAHDDVVNLAGSGEHYHALTFNMPSALNPVADDRIPTARALDFADDEQDA